MAKTGTWADHVVVSSMAKMLQRDLYIVLSAPSTSDGKCLLIVNGDTSGDKDPLLLGHFHEYHYQSLQPIEQNAPCFDREEMGSYVYIPIQFSADISSGECYNVLSPFYELFKCHIPLEPE